MTNQTQNSLFTEIELDEATNVNGGTIASHYLGLMNRRIRNRTWFSRDYFNRGRRRGFITSASYALYLMNLRRRLRRR